MYYLYWCSMALELNLNVCSHLVKAIEPCINQEILRETLDQLPPITFTRLKNSPPTLSNLDLLKKAKKLSENILQGTENTTSLYEIFSCYNQFIKSNRMQMHHRDVSNAAMEAICVGADLIDILENEDQKEAMRLAIKKIQVISGYSSALHANSLNQTLDALNIPQKHFAVSSQPLGTTHVKDCLFLILRDRVTCSTFATHVDRNTDADSIREAIKQYVPQKTSINSYIIGGHLSDETNISAHELVNVPKVSRIMMELNSTGYDFHIRWCILQKNTPVNIVYYPKEDQFFEAVPEKELSSYSACEILVHLDDENKKLLPFFIGERQVSVRLSSSVQKKLLLMLDSQWEWSKVKILEQIINGLPSSLRTYAQTKSIAVAYSKALKDIFSAVKERFPTICYADYQKALVQVLDASLSSLYVLPFSNESNSSLLSVLENVLKKPVVNISMEVHDS